MGELLLNSFCYEKWCETGGVLSPILFNLYVDPTIELLQVQIRLQTFSSYTLICICWYRAKMLDQCYIASFELDILFNANKSLLLAVGKNCSVLIDRLKLGNDNVTRSDHLKYLATAYHIQVRKTFAV